MLTESANPPSVRPINEADVHANGRKTEEFYTHAMWKVKPGLEQQFITAWRDLGKVFFTLESPSPWGTLIQSMNDPTLFYSFGPWPSLEAIQAMRSNPRAQEGIRDIMSLCEEATPANYRLAAHVEASPVS